jgi:hypothetical protein
VSGAVLGGKSALFSDQYGRAAWEYRKFKSEKVNGKGEEALREDFLIHNRGRPRRTAVRLYEIKRADTWSAPQQSQPMAICEFYDRAF